MAPLIIYNPILIIDYLMQQVNRFTEFFCDFSHFFSVESLQNAFSLKKTVTFHTFFQLGHDESGSLSLETIEEKDSFLILHKSCFIYMKPFSFGKGLLSLKQSFIVLIVRKRTI